MTGRALRARINLMSTPRNPDRFSIAILALGGQGGGVLADWILELAENNGYIAQGTSVPGVAQRTGSTIYYIEMVRRASVGANHAPPVLALMPVPGDVDVVIASELMEAGRAIVRGLVSADRTTLISSTHRIYAISEKSTRGDGRVSSQKILDAAQRRAERFIGFDMDQASTDASSVISAVMFGALAGAKILPFSDASFEDAIRSGGIAVNSNLKGFAAGAMGARGSPANPEPGIPPQAPPTSAAGRALLARIESELPGDAHAFAIEGVKRLLDYQNEKYARLYLDRLRKIGRLDDGQNNWALTRETARYLALWMSYEDTIRVADFKVRASRTARVSRDVNVGAEQLMSVTDYMHPRLQEVAETLPAWLGAPLVEWPFLRNTLSPLFKKGRHVRTTSLRWYLLLRSVAALRPMRPSTLRYRVEQQRIEGWLSAVSDAAQRDIALATEIALSARLIKGYSDTFERSLASFNGIVANARSATASDVKRMREDALAATDAAMS